MTETVPEVRVYDLVYPSPITLKEISSIVVVVELWSKEIEAYIENNTLDGFDLTEHICLEDVIPDMPSTIYNQLSNYIVTFRKSIEKWLRYHCGKVLISQDSNKDKGLNDVLSHFHDFAWDWNGTINYVRTARRMLRCDQFSLEEKFRIACLYCSEDDIKRIWPSVNKKIWLTTISGQAWPQLHYWVRKFCIPGNSSDSISHMHYWFNLNILNNQPSMEYFWNLLPSERRSRSAIDMHAKCVEVFARFILPRLNEHQLEEFLAQCASGLIFKLLICDSGRYCVLPTWMYIKDKISQNKFRNLIIKLLFVEVKGDLVEETLKLCCEIWYSAPDHIKQPFDDFVLKEESFHRFRSQIELSNPRQMKLLIAVLHDATFEERNTFWYKNWRALICGAVIEDLLEMMKLCFRNEPEIRAFKDDIMCEYENIEYYRVSSLKEGRVDKLNEYLDFCCPDERKRRQLKQRFLREDCFSLVNLVDLRLYYEFKLLNEFIDDAFEENDVRVDFKNQLISSHPAIEQILFKFFREAEFVLLMEFVDTFASEQPVIVSVKTRLSDYLREQLITGAFRSIQFINTDNWQRILTWLLGNEDDITRFKKSLPVADIFRNIVQSKLKKIRVRNRGDGGKPNKFPSKLHYFLMWYFNQNVEEIACFKRRFPSKLKSLRNS